MANHNSHLDTMVLMSLYPLHQLPHVRPVAAADYFLKNNVLSWFSQRIIGIIPMKRTAARDVFAGVYEALDKGDIVIFYPEGSRGEPERIAEMKKGIARIADVYPNVPITPVFIHGLGKVLPKDAWLPVPFFCDMFVGEALRNDDGELLSRLKTRMEDLAHEKSFAPWE
ncbi:MAG: 1-acyl-sn-glycerol-3-phosphate acyltransferase [Alphaproteobacteria bacterium]|nr:1-acyl-sn-glycerol-3-phosphate acyltransferase [Alphaproteobacteria bacterium]